MIVEQGQATGGIRNVTRISSVMQSKAMKKDSRYKKLFKLDDEDDMDPLSLLEKAHIGKLGLISSG